MIPLAILAVTVFASPEVVVVGWVAGQYYEMEAPRFPGEIPPVLSVRLVVQSGDGFVHFDCGAHVRRCEIRRGATVRAKGHLAPRGPHRLISVREVYLR